MFAFIMWIKYLQITLDYINLHYYMSNWKINIFIFKVITNWKYESNLTKKVNRQTKENQT